MKRNRFGKAAIFSPRDIKKIRAAFTNLQHRLIFEVALYTGERMGAIVQLRTEDVYDPAARLPRDTITFPSHTRKAAPGGKRATRQLSVHADLKAALSNYKIPDSLYLFPNPDDDLKHISYDAVYKYWQRKFLEIGLDGRGFSPHSPRRTFITNLARTGIGIHTLQRITGHKNLNALCGYIEDDPERIRRAIATLSY